jgi:hypothetical protein
MGSRAAWLTLAAFTVAALILALWLRPRADESRPPAAAADFSFEQIVLESPDLALDLQAVRGNVHESYTDWACLFICREFGGCHADVQLEVRFRSAGENRRLTLAGRLDGERGDVLRLGRVQRPPVNVESVERLTLRVIDTYTPGQPTPTPME